MTVESQRSTQIDLFYVGLGAAIGVIAALTVYAGFQVAAGMVAAWAPAPTADSTGMAQSLLASEASTMGLPLVEGTKAYWFVARGGGIIAYLLLWLAAFWGISMSSKMVRGWLDASLVYGMHEFLPILAMIFASLHAAVLLGDAYIGFSLTDLLLPFVGPYKPIWTGLGTLALYLGIALIASFYLRSFVSRRVWRAFHYLSYLAFTLAMVHGLMAGTDSAQPVVRWMYLLTGTSLLFATFYRVVAAAWPTTTTRAVVARSPAVGVRIPGERSAVRNGDADLG